MIVSYVIYQMAVSTMTWVTFNNTHQMTLVSIILSNLFFRFGDG